MEKVHEGDSNLVFDSHPEDFEDIQYCMDTGLRASGACRAAGRAATGRFWADQVPTEVCSHQNIEETYSFTNSGMKGDWEEDEEEPTTDTETETPEEGEDFTTTDPEGGTTTPTDPEGGETGGETGGGTTDPGTGGETGGTTDPGTGGGDTGGGTTDPGTGGETGGGTTEPEAPAPDDPEA